MKILSFVLVVASAVALPAAGDTGSNARSDHAVSQHEILRLLKDRRDAFYRGDADKFQEFEAVDFTRISEDGSFETKQEQVAYLRDRSSQQKASDTQVVYADRDLKVDVLGTVAVVTGILTETQPSAEGPHVQQSRFTEVWVSLRGRWLTLHNHYTYIRTPP